MEELKDLGGLVNKDLAFSKLPQDKVFDSENFRITTNDGNTMAARQNIKGNKAISGIPQLPCLKNITFDTAILQSLLVPGDSYSITLTVNGGLAPTFTFTFSTFTTFLNDFSNFINNDPIGVAFFGVYPITSYVGGQALFLVIPNCETIGVAYFGSTVPKSGVSPFPYRIYDEEFAIENLNGNSYNANQGFVGVPQWALNGDSFPVAGTNTYNTYMGTGVNTQAGVVVDPTPTVLVWKSTSSGQATDVHWYGDPFYVNSIQTTSPSLFEYFPGGTYKIDFSFYIAKTTNAQVTLQILLDLGPNLDLVAVASYGLSTVTLPSIGYPLIVVDSSVYPSGTTDINYLNPAYGIFWNVPGLISWTDLLVPGSSYTYNGFVLRLQGDNDPLVPGSPSHNFTTYFNSFKVQGPPLSFQALTAVNNIVTPANFGLIIGWVTLRDDIYLFTTDGTYDPDDPNTWGQPTPPVTNGQIWRFHYDKDSDYSDPASYFIGDNLGNLGVPVYSGLLNFTTARPIANPGMIESRYENPNIQKIYWTDNYNVPRQINVADPNVATLTPEQLNLLPSLKMDLPFITEVIDGGSLLVGLYQVAYRLKNTNGSETRFSRPGPLVPIIDATESGADVKTYYPRVAVQSLANKSIRVKVEKVDPNYDTIEFALIYYFDATSEPEINIVQEEFIPATINPAGATIETIITGAAPLVPITLDELTAFNTSILTCKTLAAKKQTLFLGNIVIADQKLPFDSRTYRFPINNNQTNIRDTAAGTQYLVTYNPALNTYNYDNTLNPVPTQHGAYQNYADQGPESSANYLYQPGTNILGGAGPNIKYEFFTENIFLTNKYDPTFAGSSGISNPQNIPATNVSVNFNSTDRVYASNAGSLSNGGSPYIYDIYVGYRRDEMYRFGIVFFDELDNPTYVNWIGDIRMPHFFMPTGTAGGSGAGGPRELIGYSLGASFSSAPSYYHNPNNERALYAKPLGVKFTIDFSSVPVKYKSASIVRVHMEDSYKHLAGQGMLFPVWKSYAVPGPTYASTNTAFVCKPGNANYAYQSNQTPSGNANDLWPDLWTLHCPELYFSKFLPHAGSDKLDILGLMGATDVSFLMTEQSGNSFFEMDGFNNTGTQTYVKWAGPVEKNYRILESAGTPASIKNATTFNPYTISSAQVISPYGGGGHTYSTGISTLNTNNNFSTARSVLNCAPKDVASSGGGGLEYPTPQGYSAGNKSLFIQLEYPNAAANWNYGPFGGSQFFIQDGWTTFSGTGTYHNYIANYKKQVSDPFGGQDYFSRSTNEYISCNNLIDISDRTTPIKISKVYGGDTRIGVFDHVIKFFDFAETVRMAPNNVTIFTEHVLMPLETSVALEYRRSLNNATYQSAGSGNGVANRNNYLVIIADTFSSTWNGRQTIERYEHFELDPVFTDFRKPTAVYFPEPINVVPTRYDCRVWRSEKKIDGESSDSWSIFKPSSFLDVEAGYGPLNNLVVFQDKLYFIQERGFGVLQVAEQKLITDQGGNADLVLGSSGILERYDYVSTKTGTKHQFSMSVSDYSMIWFDTLARKIYRYKPGALEPLTDIKGYSGYLYERTDNTLQTFDNPYYMNTTPGLLIWEGRGVHSTYDYRHNEFYMTFLNPDAQQLFTLVYNDLFDGFVGRYGHMPKVYINDKVNIFSPWLDPNTPNMFETIYVHNYGDYGRFYGSPFTQYSYLAFVVNSNPTLEKTFTNLEVVAEAFKDNTVAPFNDPKQYDSLAEIDYLDFFEQMRVYDNYQNTDWLFLNNPLNNQVLARRHKTIWNIKVPSDRVLSVNSNIFDIANLDVSRPRLTRRLKDKWFVVEMKYNNNLNNKIVVHTAKAIYSANSR